MSWERGGGAAGGGAPAGSPMIPGGVMGKRSPLVGSLLGSPLPGRDDVKIGKELGAG